MIREYFNKKAAIWDETVAEKDTAKLERMAKRLNIRPGSTILDVGTGTGVFIPFLLSEIGKSGRIIASDFAEKMLRRSRASINEIHRQIPAVQNDTIPDKDEMQLMLSATGFTEIKVDDNSDSYLASAGKSQREVA